MNPDTPLVNVNSITFRYDDDAAPALDRVDLQIGPREFIGLVGQNGSGKTTLARHLNGLLKPETGEVLVRGRSTFETEPGNLSNTVGYVFQNPDHALFLTTVRDEIAYSLSFRDMSEPSKEERIDRSLEAFGLHDLAAHHPASLGRGTRRLVILAATYAMEPDLLVLDEPTGGLDHRLTGNLIATLREYVAGGRSVLLISHDMQLIANSCERTIALDGGQLIADGRTGAFFQQDQVLERAGLRLPEVARLVRKLDGLGFADDTVSHEGFVRRFCELDSRCSSLGDRS